MGLLQPTVGNNHSYGTLGQEGAINNKGYHYDPTFMLDQSNEYKYTIVSVVPSIKYDSATVGPQAVGQTL